MEAEYSSENLVNFYQTMSHHRRKCSLRAVVFGEVIAKVSKEHGK
jgi:hypothetical protein